MKRLCALVAVFCVIATVAVVVTGQELPSLNASTSVQINSPSGSLVIVCSPGNPFAGTNQAPLTLDQLIGNTLNANWNFAVADNIYVWTGSQYEQAFLNDNGWGDTNLNWRWCWYPPASGTPAPCAETNIFDISIGEAFWIKNKKADKEILLRAETPSSGSTEISLPFGLSLVANPYPIDATLDELVTAADGAFANWNFAVADNVYVWTGSAYEQAFLNDNGWGDTNLNWRWCWYPPASGTPAPCAETNLFNIAVGEGFWYKSNGGSFTWSQNKPYVYP